MRALGSTAGTMERTALEALASRRLNEMRMPRQPRKGFASSPIGNAVMMHGFMGQAAQIKRDLGAKQVLARNPGLKLLPSRPRSGIARRR